MSDKRVAFVTGAANGICRATAEELAATGYDLGLFDLDASALADVAEQLRDGGSTVTTSTVDVTDHEAVRAGVTAQVAEHGRVDALVSGAGIVGTVPFLELTDEVWDRMFAVHMKGTFNIAQAVVREMKEAGYGRIVCISSMAAITGGTAVQCHYAAAKAGILGFVRSVARELGPMGITINAVAPGAVETAMAGAIDPALWAKLTDTPVGRGGRPSDVAYAIKCLLAPEAEFITGSVLTLNGGY